MLSTRWQGRQEGSRDSRPTRAEIDPAALDLISRHGPQILRTARRYSVTPDDAEDAYQRGLEILLTKAPTTSENELVPWLKTVVKHEAFAIRRQRERAAPVVDDESVLDRASHEDAIDEHAERLEQLRLGAEALGRLKPQEVRCLLLKAEGYSYKQICEITGWTYTKVNRCLTEGRASFQERLQGIQSGAECERLAPLLSALADGEASAEDMAALRPHLRGCLACRATLRDYRAAPARVAALVPPVALAGGDGGGLFRCFDWIAERATSLTLKAQGAVEMVSAQKVAAVAASTAVIAGGGVATVRTIDRPEPVRAAEHERTVRAERPALPAPTSTGPAVRADDTSLRPARANTPRPRTRERRANEERPAAAAEFDPTGNPTARAAPAPPTSRPASTAPAGGSGAAPRRRRRTGRAPSSGHRACANGPAV